jgi:hypothetical protein
MQLSSLFLTDQSPHTSITPKLHLRMIMVSKLSPIHRVVCARMSDKSDAVVDSPLISDHHPVNKRVVQVPLKGNVILSLSLLFTSLSVHEEIPSLAIPQRLSQLAVEDKNHFGEGNH